MRAFACAVLACLAVAAGAQERPRPNILLVTVDALRTDRVTSGRMPALTGLAARGAMFERAYTHAPATLPAHASILTGLLPPAHGVRNNGFRLVDPVVTLAEALRDAGYATGAFVGGSALDARFGLGQGFAHYDDRYGPVQEPSGASAFRNGARAATDVVAAAGAWVGRQREPWFAWVHVRDPHAPNAAYDTAVRTADTSLGVLLASLESRGALGRTLVVVTADHGESLGAHGEDTHGLFAYEPVLRVPLVIAGPGVPTAVVRGVTAHVDVMPTVLDLVKVPAPDSDGRSLAGAIRGEDLPDRPIYFEALDAALMRGGAPLTGVISGRWKFIDLPLPELYDVVADPSEATNRVAGEPAMATRLRDETVRLRTAPPRGEAATWLGEPEARARLRSLGYIGSSSWRLGAARVEDDPKRLLPVHRAYDAAIANAGIDPDGAIRQLRLIADQRPNFAAAIDAAGALLIARGRSKEAVALLADARAGGLRHRVLAERLAAALLITRDAPGVVALLTPVVEADDTAVDARFLLARAYAALGRVGDAQAQLQAILEIDPTFDAATDLLRRLRAR